MWQGHPWDSAGSQQQLHQADVSHRACLPAPVPHRDNCWPLAGGSTGELEETIAQQMLKSQHCLPRGNARNAI